MVRPRPLDHAQNRKPRPLGPNRKPHPLDHAQNRKPLPINRNFREMASPKGPDLSPKGVIAPTFLPMVPSFKPFNVPFVPTALTFIPRFRVDQDDSRADNSPGGTSFLWF